MASIKKMTDSNGEVVYKVQVSNGRGRRIKRSWRPRPGLSAKTIQRELQKFAADLENQLASGEALTRQEQLEQARQAALEAAKLRTLQEYSEGVFMPTKKATFSENARSSYQQFLNKHIYPSLGNFYLKDITPAMLSKFLFDFQNSGYSHATAVKLYNILNGVFQMAFLDDSIQINPMLKVKRPVARKDEKIKEESDKAFTAEEVSYILQCLDNDKEPLKWKAYINLAVDSGARRGELCGLWWQDIDWKSGTITIKRNLQYTSQKGVYETSPKNGKSRVVDIGPETLILLRQLQAEQAATCISKYVFTQDGTTAPMHPQSPTRYFKKFGERYGIKDFHPHKLRHSSASIALTSDEKVDIVSVSERLGHSDTAVTLRMYAHSNEKAIRRAGQAVRDAVKKAQG